MTLVFPFLSLATLYLLVLTWGMQLAHRTPVGYVYTYNLAGLSEFQEKITAPDTKLPAINFGRLRFPVGQYSGREVKIF